MSEIFLSELYSDKQILQHKQPIKKPNNNQNIWTNAFV